MVTRRDFISQLLLLGGSPLFLSACSEPPTMKVGMHRWIGYESLNIARELKMLPESVDLVETHGASECMQRLAMKQLDAATLTLDETLLARSQGVPLTAVMIFDSSAGADVLMTRQPLEQLSDLKGKRIAYDASALGLLMMTKILQQANLKPDDVEKIDLPLDQQLDAWQKKKIDAAITYQPYAFLLQEAGGYKLFDSREIPETIFDVLAVRTDRMNTFTQQIRGLIQAHFKAVSLLHTHSGDMIYRIASHQNILPAEVKTALKGVVLPTLAANQRLLSKGSTFEEAAHELNRVMAKAGILPKPDDFHQLFTSQFLPVDK
ncbi:MAG: ABC transporter substrate-binding protein [Hydrogenovibrio sp.]|nr:ABC transporter substrate-binding protein [Hydrogenovibrio sp.]